MWFMFMTLFKADGREDDIATGCDSVPLRLPGFSN